MLDTWGTVYFNFGPTTGFNTCITAYYGHLLQTERLFTKLDECAIATAVFLSSKYV